MAKHVMDDLVTTGKVSRGCLGAQIRSWDEGLAHAFNVPHTSGVLIEDATHGRPADMAGLKNGDVARKHNGQDVTDSAQMIALVTETNPKNGRDPRDTPRWQTPHRESPAGGEFFEPWRAPHFRHAARARYLTGR